MIDDESGLLRQGAGAGRTTELTAPVLASTPEGSLAETADASAEDASAAVCLFRSLADPARLTILRHLALGEHRVVDLTNHLGLAQSTTSAHLACLRDCGLVSSRTVGRSSMYSLAVSEELMAVLAAAERLLAATGDAVTLCPSNHGASDHDPSDHGLVEHR